jgi:hypothetical protein
MRALVLAWVVVATPAAAQPKPAVSEYEKTSEQDHAIAGMPGFSIKRVKDAGRCGGFALVLKHDKKPPSGEDKLAELLADEPPKPSLANFEQNLKKRTEWAANHQALISDLLKRYHDDFTAGNAQAKLAAVARVVQMEFHLASSARHGEIPKGTDTPEAQTVFCDGLKLQADHALESARADLAVCIGLIKAGPKGWWNDVCR